MNTNTCTFFTFTILTISLGVVAAIRIATTILRLIVKILNSVFLKTFKNFTILSNFNEVQSYSLKMIC